MYSFYKSIGGCAHHRYLQLRAEFQKTHHDFYWFYTKRLSPFAEHSYNERVSLKGQFETQATFFAGEHWNTKKIHEFR